MLLPAISGEQYLSRINEMQPNVWIRGKKVTGKLSDHPDYKGAMQTKASLYDLQLHPDLIQKMTFPSPLSQEPVGISFLQPKTKEDLERRRYMMNVWARKTVGMMGRTPDYLNTVLMTLATASPILTKQEKSFSENLLRLYEHAREHDYSFTHSFINPQVNRFHQYENPATEPIAAKVIAKTSDGLIVKGARLLATQGGMTDEVLIFPSGSKLGDDDYAFSFSIPTNTEGLKFICRESFYKGDSAFNYPLSSRFHEMETMIIFDNVLVPWDRIFFHNRQDIAYELFSKSSFTAHALHQVVIRQIVKTEFILGLAQKMVTSLDLSDYQHIKEKISEIIIGLETMKALLDRAELHAKEDQWGTITPNVHPLYVAINTFPTLYPRMSEILQLIGAGGLMAIPAEEDFQSELADDLDNYFQGNACSAVEKTKLFRLVWDLTMSSFGTRQTQYERYFFGDPIKLAETLYNGYSRDAYIRQVEDFLST